MSEENARRGEGKTREGMEYIYVLCFVRKAYDMSRLKRNCVG